MFSLCGFQSINFSFPVHLHYIDSKIWIIYLKIAVCVHLKKENHIHLGQHEDEYMREFPVAMRVSRYEMFTERLFWEPKMVLP